MRRRGPPLLARRVHAASVLEDVRRVSAVITSSSRSSTAR
jgi:hypothetical protein